mgnify:CR=1 FL=1
MNVLFTFVIVQLLSILSPIRRTLRSSGSVPKPSPKICRVVAESAMGVTEVVSVGARLARQRWCQFEIAPQ